jgi:hypothetical protein
MPRGRWWLVSALFALGAVGVLAGHTSAATTISENILALLAKYALNEGDLMDMNSPDLMDVGFRVDERVLLLREKRRLRAAQDSTAIQDFVFELRHFNTSRQSHKCINILVKYRYEPLTGITGYLDYRLFRQIVLKFAQPSEEFPEGLQWEVVNLAMAQTLLARYLFIFAQLHCMFLFSHFHVSYHIPANAVALTFPPSLLRCRL